MKAMHIESRESVVFGGSRRTAVRLAALVGAASMVAGVPALAQQTGLADIIVTAQKRSENLQDTPLSVSAVTADTIEARGISDVSSLTAAAPSLVVNQTPQSSSSPAIYIRGIGEAEPIMTVDAPNAIYVDGVVVGRSTGAMFDLVDLERIEVLRGPQGTLYGRNTTGGAINLITARPKDDIGFEQQVGIGRYNLFKSRTTFDTGEIAGSGIRAKFSYLHKQRNGYVDNVLTPGRLDPGSYNVDAMRAAVTFDNGGPFTAFYSFDWNRRDSKPIPTQLAYAAPYLQGYLEASSLLGGSAPVITPEFQSKLAIGHDGPLVDKVVGHNLTLELELGENTTLRSITGHRKWRGDAFNSGLDGNAGLVGFTVSPAILAPPYDFIPLGVGPIDLYHGTDLHDQKQWSQEVNLLGNIGDRFEYVLGAFWFQEKVAERDDADLLIVVPVDDPIELAPGLSIPAFGVPLNSLLDYRHKSESKALFGQGTYELSDGLFLTAGLRYTWDKRTLNQTEAVVKNETLKYSRLTWMATVRYEFNDDISAYGRVATGYKAGGFNPRGGSNAFEPEKVTSYEVGVKSELFDRRVRLNLAGFHTIYKDLQVSQFEAGSEGTTTVMVNAGKAHYTGIEAEVMAQLVQGLTLSGNVGYTHRKFKEYLYRDPVTNEVVNMANVARFGHGAATTLNVGLDYRFPDLGFGTLRMRGDYNYRSRIYFHPLDFLAPFNQGISDGPLSTFDARLTLSGIELNGAELAFSLWGKNLTNKHYLLQGIDFGELGFATKHFAEPRTWGLEATLRF